MRKSLLKVGLPAALAATAATAAVALGSAAPSSADPTPITGGTAALTLTLPALTVQASNGIFTLPGTPASESFDPTTNSATITFPVSGGDGSINTFYGDVDFAGTLTLVNSQTMRHVTFSALTFRIQDDVILGTPTGSTKPEPLFDTVGNIDFSGSPSPETFSASNLRLDRVGSVYLNKVLHTEAFRPTAHVGSFTTSFTNSVDG